MLYTVAATETHQAAPANCGAGSQSAIRSTAFWAQPSCPTASFKIVQRIAPNRTTSHRYGNLNLMSISKLRRTIVVPEAVAAKVKELALLANKSEGKVFVELVQSGLTVLEERRRVFSELTDRLANTVDRDEQQRIRQELERITFQSH
jgi:hypothetical protein